MNEQDRILLHNSLIEANRAPINITEPDLSERSFQKSTAIENSLAAYGNLLYCQGTLPLLPDESAHVQGVLDRLRALLKFLGEDV